MHSGLKSWFGVLKRQLWHWLVSAQESCRTRRQLAGLQPSRTTSEAGKSLPRLSSLSSFIAREKSREKQLWPDEARKDREQTLKNALDFSPLLPAAYLSPLQRRKYNGLGLLEPTTAKICLLPFLHFALDFLHVYGMEDKRELIMIIITLLATEIWWWVNTHTTEGKHEFKLESKVYFWVSF